MKYSLDWLKNKVQKREALDYLFFWGHQPSKDGTLTNSCFSQWWLSDFEAEGVTYKSAEHFMMAEKARVFGDKKMLMEILKSETPAEAKKLGRKVSGFHGEIWSKHRSEIVVRGNIAKFSSRQNMKEYLLNTGDKVLVEASPRDRIWGIGMGQNNENARDPFKWRGLNLLGFALMEVRDNLN